MAFRKFRPQNTSVPIYPLVGVANQLNRKPEDLTSALQANGFQVFSLGDTLYVSLDDAIAVSPSAVRALVKSQDPGKI